MATQTLAPAGTARLILTLGLPGAGKTTWALAQVAADPTIVRVNRDDVRHQMFGAYVLTGEQEAAVTTTQRTLVDSALRDGHTVIVDDTNLTLRARQQLSDVAARHGAPVDLVPFLVDVDTAAARCATRYTQTGERDVPRHVIEKMAQQFLADTR